MTTRLKKKSTKRLNKPLVTQFLEKVGVKAIKECSDVLKSYANQRHGIYALYKRERLYYVGLATSLKGRLGTHLRDRHKGKWDRFSIFLTISHSHIKELESLILRIADPTGNSAKGKFAKAENLMQRFRSDVMDRKRQELDVLLGSRPKSRSKGNESPAESSTALGKHGVGRMKLCSKFKGKTYRASVLKDGSIRYGGKIYKSPSLAAAAVTKRPMNGWTFWKYLRGPGDWVEIDKLRK